MAMAVSCAHLNRLGPRVVTIEAKTSCSCSSNAAPSSPSAFLFRKSLYGTGSRIGHRSLVCRASGSRKEKEKRRGGSSGNGNKSDSVKGDDAKLDEILNTINDDTDYGYDDTFVAEDGNDADEEGFEDDDDVVGDEVSEIRAEGEGSARAVASSTEDAADASGKRIQKAGRRVGQNVDEVRKAGQTAVGESAEVVNQQAGRAAENIQEGLEEAGETAQDLAGIAQENAEEAGQRLQEAGRTVGRDLESIGKEGQNVAAKAGERLRNQVREASKELGEGAEQAEQTAERAIRSTIRRAQASADRVQDPIEKAVNASLDAASAIGDEVFKLGDSIIEAVEEATGIAGPDRSFTRSGTLRKSESEDEPELVGGKYKPAGKSVAKRYQGAKEGGDEELQQEADGDFTGLSVLVAGATGATGRLIVQDLVGKGATVRALVRNVYRARNLKQLQGAELFEADLYNYESVKEALSGNNVVISAAGARGFDLVQAYKTEYEGVLNLIAAAKNQGDVKKFVLITTIGVNFLQIVPLLYWKRQAELFLQRSGLDYTIVRPAGLTGDRGGDKVELRPADSLFLGAVSRKKVAEVCVSALVTPSATDKTVELVGGSGRVRRSIADQFDSI